MNKELPNIGIIGFGFLGRALAHGFILHANLKIYDKYQNEFDTLEDTVNSSEYIFVSVPTPMKDDGSQDLSNLHDALLSINKVANSPKMIILRSTILPGTTRTYAEAFRRHDFIFMPEFLTERTAKLDFINPARIIFGTNGSDVATKLIEMFRIRFPHNLILETSYEAAEVCKYMANCFFAVKLSFLNEMYDVAEKIGVEYDELKKLFMTDFRIGNSHLDVPGHDGDRGWGGKCYPKDINAFACWAEYYGLTAEMCRAAISVNERVRSNKDWLNIKGATSENNYKEEN